MKLGYFEVLLPNSAYIPYQGYDPNKALQVYNENVAASKQYDNAGANRSVILFRGKKAIKTYKGNGESKSWARNNNKIKRTSNGMATWKKATAYRVLADGRVQVKTAPARKNPAKKRRRKNVEKGFFDAYGFHPIRSSSDYDESRVGETSGYARKSKAKSAASRAKRLAANRAKAYGKRPNPAKKKGTYTRAMMLANLARGRAKRAANLKKKR